MSKDDESEIIKYALQEVKDQYQIYLDGFDDRKKKVQIFLVVCSLMITLPLSNNFIIERIISSMWLIAFFVSGIITLIITILILIYSIMEIHIRIPAYTDILDSIGKYKADYILKGVARAYANDLNKNITRGERKRELIKLAEKLIIPGILLISITLLYTLLFT